MRMMNLGLSLRGLGYHQAAWRHRDVPPLGMLDLGYAVQSARLAEAAKLDMIFFADADGSRPPEHPPTAWPRTHRDTVELEPLMLLAALAPLTQRIGLVATASTTYNEPFHLARRFATLDHLSGGRAGWNVVTSWSDLVAQNFSRDRHEDYAKRYARAAEFVAVVRGLWDSWEEDAFPADKESGLFFDPAKLHVLNHVGEFYRVRGPLTVARSPQGQPVIVQAGASDTGIDLAAQTAEVVFVAQQDMEEARLFYNRVKARVAAHGRDPEKVRVLPGITPIIAPTEAEVVEKLAYLDSLVPDELALSAVYYNLGDLSDLPIDGPVPAPRLDSRKSRSELLAGMAQREGLSIRELGRVLSRSVHAVFAGTPVQIADRMEAWFRAGACDGFNICPTHYPGGTEDFTAMVVPELQRRGLFRTEYTGDTLRDHLGLARPVHGA